MNLQKILVQHSSMTKHYLSNIFKTHKKGAAKVNPQPDEIKEFRLIVTPKLVRGIGVIKPGDIIQKEN